MVWWYDSSCVTFDRECARPGIFDMCWNPMNEELEISQTICQICYLFNEIKIIFANCVLTKNFLSKYYERTSKNDQT
jgi:hypothetical protein